MGDRLFVSFSGGRTSGYMAQRLKREYDGEMVFVFANTGQEDDRTLDFVDQCDKAFGLNVVWVEAVVDPRENKGTKHRIVTYESATRRTAPDEQQPFTHVIRKYGIPNQSYPHCTRELKERPMESYIKSIGWKGCDVALGIRADEIDRMKKEPRFKHPLVGWGIKKPDVLKWWRTQPFNLQVPEHLGNCVTCRKKSDRKLFTLMQWKPSLFGFFERLGKEYPHAGAGVGPRVFWRGKRSIEQMFLEAESLQDPFVEGDPDQERQLEALDKTNGCSDSCEPFADGIEDEAS